MKYCFYGQTTLAFVSINIWDSFPFPPFPTHFQCCSANTQIQMAFSWEQRRAPDSPAFFPPSSLSHQSASCWTEQRRLCAFPLQLASSNDVSPHRYKGNIYLGENFVQVTINNSGNVVPLKCGGESSLFLLGLQPKRKRVSKKGRWIKTMKDTYSQVSFITYTLITCSFYMFPSFMTKKSMLL